MKDVIIVGGGLAGLSAAWRLRHFDTLVLESESRVGGRIRSEKRGRYFLNWGGHVFAGEGSSTHALLGETGTRAVTVPGVLAGLQMNGKLLLKGQIASYPFRVPMSLSSRVALLKTGARVGLDVLRYARVVRKRAGETPEMRQQRIYDFENTRSFQDYVGDLSPDVEALFKPTVTRSAADMDQLAAGAGIGYFSLVFNVGQGLNQHIAGGPSTLIGNIAGCLGERIERGAQVTEVIHREDSVLVRYERDGKAHEVEARTVVMATPATVTHRVTRGLPEELHQALGQIRYGEYVSAAFLTNETSPRPWDGAYGIATPKRSFNIALNMGNVVRGGDSTRQPGGSLMVFSPASLARELIDLSDEEITETYLRDLDDALPGFRADVTEAVVQRWRTGAPYCFPGRAALQPVLTNPARRIFLAGDYLGTLYTETAISSGFAAATHAASLLAPELEHATIQA
ncbi:FAD-dependent oxidoreductase [Glutamicibacter sp. MNS18]|uniref:flavin monoamine oxidase family protein n=1 Tax=Glutamicibacter sp. MNS18 TaxID=2989817 RepID=UPI0022358E0A|nr:NAD(P)/FAD-dependent oxidoreductase [Glutamicibacter sp. MNS18]MCW4466661.1 FAD-dependent oxidoreductase [Glutamicibacter sp. MNS18]